MANNQLALLAQAPVFDTPFETQTKGMNLRALMNQDAVGEMDLVARRRAVADEDAMRSIFAANAEPGDRLRELYRVNPKAAMAMEKAQVDLGKDRATTAKTQGEADNERLKGLNMRMQQARDLLGNISDQQGAATWVQGMYNDPDIGKVLARFIGPVEQAVKRIPDPQTDPDGFANWRRASQLNAEKLVEQTKPALSSENLGGQRVFVSRDPFTGKVTTNSTMTNTQSPDNAASVSASLENAAATREVAKATRDSALIQRDQASEQKLADDYRAQSKGFKEVADAYRLIVGTLDQATKSPAATLAGATKFMKLLDPGSVVRESELGMALAAAGVLDRAANYFQTLKLGKVLTPSQVEDFKNIATEVYKAAQIGQRDVDRSFRQTAETYKLRPETILQDFGQNRDMGSRADAAAPEQKKGAGKGASAAPAGAVKFLGWETP